MMKFLLLLSLIAVVQSTVVKIMSFNIDCRVCDLEKAHGESWDDRVQNELDTIARHDPDIIGIQEPIFRRDVQQLTPKGYRAIYFDKADWLPWGVYPDAVIMYKESRFIQKDFNMFWLGPNSSFPAGFDRLALPRLAVYSLFEDRKDKTNFYFGSTHFDHGDDLEGRNIDCTASAKELLSFTEPVAAKYPFLWVGDFNSETANNNAYAILTNQTSSFHLEDSYYASPSHAISSNLNPLPEYDYNHSIDHIFYANNKDIASYTPLDWTVDMYVYGEKQQYASDHYAIISTVEIKQL
mmetsp:Transcript_10500/g.11321  ORF Transcript_10500/g.11321 Transcript_10500/m.11321 type:complete len:295 (+) Transcript_10500:64-948(+)|eukprot:gene4823-5177_t